MENQKIDGYEIVTDENGAVWAVKGEYRIRVDPNLNISAQIHYSAY